MGFLGGGWCQAVPQKWKANFLCYVRSDFPQEDFQRGSWGSGLPTRVPRWGHVEDSLAAACEPTCLFGVVQKGKRKDLRPTQATSVHQCTTLFLCVPLRLFGICAHTKGWGSICSPSENSSNCLHRHTPTCLEQQQCSLPSSPRDGRGDVCKRLGNL